MHLTLTNRDFLIGKVVEPAFYDVVINEVEESLSKAGDSTNWELKAEVLQNADTGDKTNAGVPVPRWAFNSKAGGFVIPLYASIGQELKPGDTLDLKQLKGQKVRLFIGNDEYPPGSGTQVNSLGRNPKYRPING